MYVPARDLNSYPPGQNGCKFADGIFKHIFMNEKILYFDQNFTEVYY